MSKKWILTLLVGLAATLTVAVMAVSSVTSAPAPAPTPAPAPEPGPAVAVVTPAAIVIPDADTPLKVSGIYNASGTILIDAEDVEMGDKAYVELTSFPSAANCTYKLDKAAPGLSLALVNGNLRLARGGLIIIIM